MSDEDKLGLLIVGASAVTMGLLLAWCAWQAWHLIVGALAVAR